MKKLYSAEEAIARGWVKPAKFGLSESMEIIPRWMWDKRVSPMGQKRKTARRQKGKQK